MSPCLLQPMASHSMAPSHVSRKMEKAPLPKTGKECAALPRAKLGV